jgi:hypothetical protein
MPPKDRMILPSAPRFTLAWAIGEVQGSAIGLTMAGMVRLVSPALLAPRLRFGGAIQNRKAALEHGAYRINSHVGDIAQAEVANLATGAMLGLSIRDVLVGRRALRHQA